MATRPPKLWIEHCIRQVKRGTKAVKRAASICSGLWYNTMDRAAKSRAAARHRGSAAQVRAKDKKRG